MKGETHGQAGEQTVAAVLQVGTDVHFQRGADLAVLNLAVLNMAVLNLTVHEAARNYLMAVVDTRHEQTVTLSAEAYSKLIRRPSRSGAAYFSGPPF